MQKILIVEDDKKSCNQLKEVFASAGYEADVVYNPIDGIEFFHDNAYILVIIDLHLEIMNGLRFISYIKKINPKIRTIILDANPSTKNELDAMYLEVDQYLNKNVHHDVLLRYVVKILEATTDNNFENQTNVLKSELHDITVDLKRRSVRQYSKEVNVTYKEFQILCYLLQNTGNAVSREELITAIWDTEYESVDERVIDSHIKTMRRKLDIMSLISVRGYGYKWSE